MATVGVSMNTLDKLLSLYGFGKIQDCSTIMSVLEKNNVTMEEFHDWIQMMRSKYRPPTPRPIPPPPRRVLKRKCPSCGGWLTLQEVNNSDPRLQVGGDWKCQWLCPNCWWDDYSKEDIKSEAKPYIEEV